MWTDESLKGVDDRACEKAVKAHATDGTLAKQLADKSLDVLGDRMRRGKQWLPKLLSTSSFSCKRACRSLIGELDLVLSPLDTLEQFDMIGGLERRFADGHLEKHGADRPEIRLCIVFLEPKNLWSHVQWGAAESFSQCVDAQVSGEAKVCYLHLWDLAWVAEREKSSIWRLEKKVLWLYITMDDVASTHELESGSKLGQDRTDDDLVEPSVGGMWVLWLLFPTQRAWLSHAGPLVDIEALLDVLREVARCAERHDEIDLVLGLETFLELNNVWMMDSFENGDFAFEVVKKLGCQLLTNDNFDGDGLPGLDAIAFVDHSKRAFANLVLHNKVTDA